MVIAVVLIAIKHKLIAGSYNEAIWFWYLEKHQEAESHYIYIALVDNYASTPSQKSVNSIFSKKYT